MVDGHTARFGVDSSGDFTMEVECPDIGTCGREIYDAADDAMILTDECFVQFCAQWFELDWIELHDNLPLGIAIEIAWRRDGTRDEPIVGVIPVAQMAAANG